MRTEWMAATAPGVGLEVVVAVSLALFAASREEDGWWAGTAAEESRTELICVRRCDGRLEEVKAIAALETMMG
jgi:hypothetical protein